MDPLLTDEPLPPGHKHKGAKDLDTVMLGGCSAFVVTSIGTYLLTLWPHLAFSHTEFRDQLATACAIGLIPAWGVGLFATRKAGLPAACGFVAGAMTTGVFLFLRLKQIFDAASANQSPAPNYPASFQWLIPGAWIAVVLFTAFVFLPRTKEAPELAPERES